MTADTWRPAASPAVLHARAAMLARARAYFAREDVLEVQTPVLSAAAACDPAIESIAARMQRGATLFLQTSPEFAMKRLLAAGLGNCYQICPVFRDGESGRFHNPEFTMIEWYRLDYGVAQMERDVDRLLRAACGELRSFGSAHAVTYREAVADACALDSRTADIAAIRSALAQAGVMPAGGADWDRDAWLDLLMGAVVGPRLGHEAPVFVHDYPASQAALARLRREPDGGEVAERFELYVDGIELANGFSELGDAQQQRRRFERDLEARRRHGQPANPADERLIAALEHGLPACAGVALGFDRLVMVALGLPSLEDAMPFPIGRA
jgi:lysyl-tRNA synthetase class 2